jgi:hypothetical protein
LRKVFDSNEISLDLPCKLLIPKAKESQSLDSIAFESIVIPTQDRRRRLFIPIVNYSELERENFHADVFVQQVLSLLRGLTCDFRAENEKNSCNSKK